MSKYLIANFAAQRFSKLMQKFGNSSIFKLFLACALLVLIAHPKSPFLIINEIKKKSEQIALLVPGNKLSEILSVSNCPEAGIYDTASNYNQAKSGFKVFKTRLAKEYQNASKSFKPLAHKVLTYSQTSSSKNNTCLLPLKISASSGLGVNIANSDLLDVSIGSQSIFCSNNKAYLTDNDLFFPLDKTLTDYATQIKKKKAVINLTKQLKALQKKKATLPISKKTEKVKIDKQIRKISLNISYAQYFIKDAALLAQFFDAVCEQTAIILTPNSVPATISPTKNLPTTAPTLLVPTYAPSNTRVATITAIIPTLASTIRQTVVPTVVSTKTATATRSPLISVTNTALASPNRTATVAITLTPEPTSIAANNLCASGSAAVISQHEITWAFDKSYPCGRFANGDYWVLGPIKITNITPGFSNGRNGTMINPAVAGTQGFDNLAHGFNASLNISLPVNISSESSVISSIGRTSCSAPAKCRPALKTAAVLTVLTKKPANNGQTFFRPAYAGSNKKLFSVDQLQANLLPRKSAPSKSLPTLAQIERNFQRPWLDFQGDWTGAFIHPTDNMPEYGADLANATNSGALRLMLDNSFNEKRAALIAYIQYGIDLYGNLALNPMYKANGGHMHGRILPLVFAATLLNSMEIKQAILDRGFENFQEDGSVIISKTTGKALFGQASTGSEFDYWQNQMIDRNTRTAPDPYGYIDGGLLPGGYYHSCCTSSNYKGTALALKLMPKLREIWQADKFITYSERWVREGTIAAPDPCAPATVYNRKLNSSDPKHIQLWNTINAEPDESKRMIAIWANRIGFGYGSLFGPDGKGSCIKGTGRFVARHGIEKDGGGYQNPFVNELWKIHDK